MVTIFTVIQDTMFWQKGTLWHTFPMRPVVNTPTYKALFHNGVQIVRQGEMFWVQWILVAKRWPMWIVSKSPTVHSTFKSTVNGFMWNGTVNKGRFGSCDGWECLRTGRIDWSVCADFSSWLPGMTLLWMIIQCTSNNFSWPSSSNRAFQLAWISSFLSHRSALSSVYPKTSQTPRNIKNLRFGFNLEIRTRLSVSLEPVDCWHRYRFFLLQKCVNHMHAQILVQWQTKVMLVVFVLPVCNTWVRSSTVDNSPSNVISQLCVLTSSSMSRSSPSPIKFSVIAGVTSWKYRVYEPKGSGSSQEQPSSWYLREFDVSFDNPNDAKDMPKFLLRRRHLTPLLESPFLDNIQCLLSHFPARDNG